MLEGLVQASVLTLTALGLSLVFGVMRVVNVAHGEFFMLGAVVAWWVSNMIGGSPLAGFLIALIVGPLFADSVTAVAPPASTPESLSPVSCGGGASWIGSGS